MYYIENVKQKIEMYLWVCETEKCALNWNAKQKNWSVTTIAKVKQACIKLKLETEKWHTLCQN